VTNSIKTRARLVDKELVELVRDANREITPAVRHRLVEVLEILLVSSPSAAYDDAYRAAKEAADLIERQVEQIAKLEAQLSRLTEHPVRSGQPGDIIEQIIAAAMDCIRHDVSPEWQRAALRNRLNVILARQPAAQRLETTSENIARDIREGRFPQRSGPQMVDDTAPSVEQDERLCDRIICARLGKCADDDAAQWLKCKARAAPTSTNVAKDAGAQCQQIGTSEQADFERGTWTFRMRPGFVVTAGEYLIVRHHQCTEGSSDGK
jgi:hypothetical protein